MAYAFTKTVAQLRAECPEEQLTSALAAVGFTDEQIDRIVQVVTGHCRACYEWVGDGMCYCDYNSRPDF
jgi:Holliday junction resolvasome RuvABC DNA-binding subunit